MSRLNRFLPCLFSSRVTRDTDTTNLPPPSEKESVSVYLRIKPKTPEESEFYSCSDESDMVNCEDENFEVVTIESTHQVRRYRVCQGLLFTNFGILVKAQFFD